MITFWVEIFIEVLEPIEVCLVNNVTCQMSHFLFFPRLDSSFLIRLLRFCMLLEEELVLDYVEGILVLA